MLVRPRLSEERLLPSPAAAHKGVLIPPGSQSLGISSNPPSYFCSPEFSNTTLFYVRQGEESVFKEHLKELRAH